MFDDMIQKSASWKRTKTNLSQLNLTPTGGEYLTLTTLNYNNITLQSLNINTGDVKSIQARCADTILNKYAITRSEVFLPEWIYSMIAHTNIQLVIYSIVKEAITLGLCVLARESRAGFIMCELKSDYCIEKNSINTKNMEMTFYMNDILFN